MSAASALQPTFNDPRTPLPRLLAAAAAELLTLAQSGDRLHAIVERRMEGGPLEAPAIEDAQFIDYLVQHLETVGLFLDMLAAESPDVGIDDAGIRDRLPLADLARRLGGDHAPAAALAGDLDLF